jgi:hypothetical protein
MRERFLDKNFSAQRLALIETLNGIIADYQRQGYVLSLRQLYYQMVARDLIENTVLSYKRLGDVVSDARLAGLIDWAMIEDRGRETVNPPMWDSPAQIVQAAAEQFAIDRWKDQENHVEICVEKAALEGVLIPVCRERGVRFTANRGYSSQSAMYEMGKRMEQMRHQGKNVFVLYLGDHDPSGIDMTRDVRERLQMFSRGRLKVDRLALNMDQVEEWSPPENPAKTTDSRYSQYMLQFGESSWELDAIEPATLGRLVRNAINSLMDKEVYDEAVAREQRMKDRLLEFAESYNENDEK